MSIPTYPLLCQTAGALVLGVAEKLNNALLVGGKASDLTGDLADESGPLGEESLAAGDLLGRLPRGDLCP